MDLKQSSDVELFVKGIYNGTEKRVPKTPDQLLALSFALIEYANKASNDQLVTLMDYIDTMPDEFGILTLRDISELKGYGNTLMPMTGFRKLCQKYKDLIM